jgi:hypothetical protein
LAYVIPGFQPFSRRVSGFHGRRVTKENGQNFRAFGAAYGRYATVMTVT